MSKSYASVWAWVTLAATVVIAASTYGLGKNPDTSPEYKAATAFTIVGVVVFLFGFDRAVLRANAIGGGGAIDVGLYKLLFPM